VPLATLGGINLVAVQGHRVAASAIVLITNGLIKRRPGADLRPDLGAGGRSDSTQRSRKSSGLMVLPPLCVRALAAATANPDMAKAGAGQRLEVGMAFFPVDGLPWRGIGVAGLLYLVPFTAAVPPINAAPKRSRQPLLARLIPLQASKEWLASDLHTEPSTGRTVVGLVGVAGGQPANWFRALGLWMASSTRQLPAPLQAGTSPPASSTSGPVFRNLTRSRFVGVVLRASGLLTRQTVSLAHPSEGDPISPMLTFWLLLLPPGRPVGLPRGLPGLSSPGPGAASALVSVWRQAY